MTDLHAITEKQLETYLIDKINKMKGWCLKFWGISFTGFPDRIILLPGGKIFFIELKRPGKEIKKGSRQELVLKQLRSLGFYAEKLNSYSDIDVFYIHIKFEAK